MSSSYAGFSAHAKSRWSMVIAFVWGFAEATAFFIVPDVYLGFVALFNWRRGLSAAIAGLLGAMLGGALMYLLGMSNPEWTNRALTYVPLVDAALVNDVADQTHSNGLLAVLSGPLRGTPYKIYAAQAGQQALPLLSFLLMTIPARLGRFIPVALFFGGIGKWFQAICEKHTKLVVGCYISLWGLIYFVFISYFGFH